jgi:hypothetical protein
MLALFEMRRVPTSLLYAASIQYIEDMIRFGTVSPGHIQKLLSERDALGVKYSRPISGVSLIYNLECPDSVRNSRRSFTPNEVAPLPLLKRDGIFEAAR